MKQFSKTCILGLAALLLLGGCDMYSESVVTQKKIQVSEDRFLQQLPVADVTDSYIAGIADAYGDKGEGPLSITVTYDAQSVGNTAMNASETLAGIVQNFKFRGVNDLQADILPIHNQGEDSHVIISYTYYTASVPDCGEMPGMNGKKEVGYDETYELGCTMQGLYAKQTVNPKDLLGREAGKTTDGRRGSNVVERYRTGEPNKPLEGESASE